MPLEKLLLDNINWCENDNVLTRPVWFQVMSIKCYQRQHDQYQISKVNIFFACRSTMVGGMDIEQGGLSAEQGQKTQSGYSVIQVRLRYHSNHVIHEFNDYHQPSANNKSWTQMVFIHFHLCWPKFSSPECHWRSHALAGHDQWWCWLVSTLSSQ